MAYTEVPAHAYGGLRLDIPADEVGLSGAIDLLNVELDRPGSVRSRDGTSQIGSDFAALSNTNWPVALFPWGSSSFVSTMFGAGSVLASDTGTVSASRTSGVGLSAVPFGTPTATRAYIGETANLVRLEGTTFTALGYPTGANLAVTPNDNRLVLAYTIEAGPTTYSSRVRFSDVGAPETFTAANYVDLDPGNGEDISAAAVWNGLLFVFKPSRFYVFYGNSTDATGGPVFNYRRVETGIGVAVQGNGGQNCVCATPDGLYFVGKDGLFRTTGGPPERVPSPLEPLSKKDLDGSYGRFFAATVAGTFFTTMALSYANGYLLVTTPASAAVISDRVTFAFHLATQTWTFWDLSSSLFCQSPAGSSNIDKRATIFLKTGSAAKPGLWRKYPGLSADGSTAITSRYRPGFYDLGQNIEKRTRGASVWGTGNLSYQSSKDFGALDTASSLSLGAQHLNLITNPAAVTNTDGWTNTSLTTFERSTSLPTLTGLPTGVTTGFHAVGNAAADAAKFTVAVTSGTTYFFTMYAYPSINSGLLRLRIDNAAASVKAETTDLSGTGTWTRLSTSVTADATENWTFYIRQTGAGATDFYFTAVMVTATSAAPAYVHSQGTIGRSIFDHPKDGTVISHQFSSHNGMPWTVHRHSIEMEPPKQPGSKTT